MSSHSLEKLEEKRRQLKHEVELAKEKASATTAKLRSSKSAVMRAVPQAIVQPREPCPVLKSRLW